MIEIILIVIFSTFILWLGSKILDKAGLNKLQVFYLLIPVVNIIMIWVFAFTHWPKLKSDTKQDL
jgi:amino acid transporter